MASVPRYSTGIRVYRENLLPADSTLFPQVSFPVTFQLDAHTHMHVFSLSRFFLVCVTPRGKKKKGKKKGLEKKADR